MPDSVRQEKGDLISREDALKALDEMSYKSPHESATSVVRKKHFGEILEKFIMQQPSTQQWIPVSERLPEKHKTVLITHRGGVSFGWHNGKHWERGASQNHRPLQTVVAWMPLPEPYKGEE